jgi:hypothetical protein
VKKMAQKCNALALGYAGAILSAIYMLLLSILASLGIYATAAQQMANWHMFYSVTVLGTITGMIEAAIHGFIALYLLAWLYNKFS